LFPSGNLYYRERPIVLKNSGDWKAVVFDAHESSMLWNYLPKNQLKGILLAEIFPSTKVILGRRSFSTQ
jgi:hypothetical protein